MKSIRFSGSSSWRGRKWEKLTTGGRVPASPGGRGGWGDVEMRMGGWVGWWGWGGGVIAGGDKSSLVDSGFSGEREEQGSRTLGQLPGLCMFHTGPQAATVRGCLLPRAPQPATHQAVAAAPHIATGQAAPAAGGRTCGRLCPLQRRQHAGKGGVVEGVKVLSQGVVATGIEPWHRHPGAGVEVHHHLHKGGEYARVVSA